jgi:hypothetical protein
MFWKPNYNAYLSTNKLEFIECGEAEGNVQKSQDIRISYNKGYDWKYY